MAQQLTPVKGKKTNHTNGLLTTPHTFCSGTQSGTLVWPDPEGDLTLSVFTNHTVHQPWLVRPRLRATPSVIRTWRRRTAANPPRYVGAVHWCELRVAMPHIGADRGGT
jgi:hypothetical protein